MWLRQPEHPRYYTYGWTLDLIKALASYTIVILGMAELTGFREICDPIVLLISGWLICLTFGIAEKSGKQNWFYIGVQILILVAVLIGRKQVQDGIGLFWNQLGDRWMLSTGYVLPELTIQLPTQEHGTCLLYFSALAGCLAAWIICWLIQQMDCMAAPVLGILYLAAMIVFSANASFGYLVPVLSVMILLLLSSSRSKKHTPLAGVWSWVLFSLASLILLSAAFLPVCSEWAAQYSEQMHDRFHSWKYETDYTTLPEGDFTEYKETGKEKHPALMVTMDQPEAMYLRGFTGSVFKEDAWLALDKEALVKNEELLYWINQNVFYLDTQFETAASFLGKDNLSKNNVYIQNVGACSKYYYVPFQLKADDFLEAENLNTDGVDGSGKRMYAYSVVADSPAQIMPILEYLQNSDEEKVIDYRKAESAYRGFVYSHYLQISQEEMDLLGDQWEMTAARYGSADNMSVQQAQECALRFLGNCFPEEGISEDLVLPLDDLRGSSYQYATVVTLTLRYFGFPARYVEGYIITDEMVANADSQKMIEVDSSHASAWVEIYQDGIGWIPMNMTPGMGEMTEEMAGDGPGDSDVPKNETKEGEELEDETPKEDTTEEEPDDGYMTMINKGLTWSAVLILAIFLLLILFLFLRRRYMLKQQREKYLAEDRREAVTHIFADTLTILEILGLDRGNGSVLELKDPILWHWGEEPARELCDANDLNRQALFSSHEITEEQRQMVLGFHDRILEQLQTDIKWMKRQWIKWIRCLY